MKTLKIGIAGYDQKTMSRYGLVELKEGQRGRVIPRVRYGQVRLDVSFASSPQQVA